MQRNTTYTWILIAFLGGIDAFWLPKAGLVLAPAVTLPTLLPILIAAGVAALYTYVRIEPRIATLCHMIAATLAFTAVTMVLSYLTVTLRRPLIDDALVAADLALRLNWVAMYGYISDQPSLHLALKLIYLSLVPQMILLQIILNFRGQIRRAWEFQWLFFAVSLGCLMTSALWPAFGAFGHFHVNMDEPYVHEFMALRAGSLSTVGVGGVQGIIQFPSLHTALALLYIYAARGIRFLFPLFIVLNSLIILATPAIGGHHFADLWGGAALAILVILASRIFIHHTQQTLKTEVPA